MANILAIIANPRKNSYTGRLMQSFLNEYGRYHPNDAITELDVYKTEIPVINNEVLAAWSKGGKQLTNQEQSILEKVDHFTRQFLEADKIVIAAPMWNLQFPPLLIAYLANIIVSGKTFAYTETGWKGLVPNKPVLLIHVRGGIFSSGPAKEYDHAVPYLKSVFSLLGIFDFQTIICEGIEANPAQSEEIFKQAALETVKLAESF